jgi:hypothetical protein
MWTLLQKTALASAELRTSGEDGCNISGFGARGKRGKAESLSDDGDRKKRGAGGVGGKRGVWLWIELCEDQ